MNTIDLDANLFTPDEDEDFDAMRLEFQTLLNKVRSAEIIYGTERPYIRPAIALRRERAARREAETLTELATALQAAKPGKLPRKLGCWVDGKLKYQSRDHASVHEYAERKMQPYTTGAAGHLVVNTHNVWVAPVGAFVEV